MTLKTIPECAAALEISDARLRRAVAKGKVKGLQLGNRTLVDINEAQEALCSSKYVKIDTVMEHTGLTYSAIRRAVRDGWLPCDTSGKAFLFDLDAVKAAIVQRMDAQNTKE